MFIIERQLITLMDGGFDVVIKNTKGQISIDRMKTTFFLSINIIYIKQSIQILKFVESYFFMH